MIISGCLCIVIGTVLFNMGVIGVMPWMTMAGLGLYLGYIPYNAIFFERMIASFHYKSNIGFIIYVSDSIGYLGSVSVLLVKELGHPTISWTEFFKGGVLVVGGVGAICASLSLLYFLQSARKSKRPEVQAELMINPA